MNKVNRFIKIGLMVIYMLTFIGLVGVEIWLSFTGVGFSISPFLYWLLLAGGIIILWIFKWGSTLTLSGAFVLFVISAFFTISGERVVSEILMRMSFLGWVVGLGQVLIENKKVKRYG